MGCKHSKSAAGAVAEGGAVVSPHSIKKTASKDSATFSLRSTRSRDVDRIYKMLTIQAGESLDEKAVLSAMTPEAAAYQNPDTRSTPLHLAVKLLDSDATTDSLLPVLSELIRAYPDAIQTQDAEGNTPLHFAIAPSNADSNSLPSSS
jgi:hypothetical protein